PRIDASSKFAAYGPSSTPVNSIPSKAGRCSRCITHPKIIAHKKASAKLSNMSKPPFFRGFPLQESSPLHHFSAHRTTKKADNSCKHIAEVISLSNSLRRFESRNVKIIRSGSGQAPGRTSFPTASDYRTPSTKKQGLFFTLQPQ